MNHSRKRFSYKLFRQSLALALCLLLCLTVLPGAMAEDSDSGIIDAQQLDSWMEDYTAQQGLNGNYQSFSVGFCYTATGDCWFYNADDWMYSASLYKVPVSMLLAEKEAAGELTQESQISNEYASGTLHRLESTALINSNNDSGHALVEYMGGSYAGKCSDQTIKFTDLEESYFSDDFYNLSYYTARYMTQIMKTLYDGGEEAYPHVLEYLLQAQPEDYFNSDPNMNNAYDIAQKYGAFEEKNGNNNNHCAAIIYTPTPIVVVVMTRNVGDYQRRMAEVASYLADYSRQLDEKKAALDRETEEAAAALEAEQPVTAQPVDGEASLGSASSQTPVTANPPEAVQSNPSAADDPLVRLGARSPLLLTIFAGGLISLLMLGAGVAADHESRNKHRK